MRGPLSVHRHKLEMGPHGFRCGMWEFCWKGDGGKRIMRGSYGKLYNPEGIYPQFNWPRIG